MATAFRSLAHRLGPGLLLGLLLGGALSAAESTSEAPPFRATSQRSFEDVEHWVSVFDDPARAAWQKPAEVVAALALTAGARVADLGAGTGYFEPHLSRAVGPDGSVFAVEVEPRLVSHLRDRAEKEGTANVIPVLGSKHDPRLPTALLDLVLIVDTFHHIDHRLAYFQGLRRVLRPGGRVAVIDWYKRELPEGPKPAHKLRRERVIEEMQRAGYRLQRSLDFLPYQYFLIFAVEG